MPVTSWSVRVGVRGSKGAKQLARDLRDLDESLRALGNSSGVLRTIANDAAAIRGAKVRVRSERAVGDEGVRQHARVGRAARTEMMDSERIRRSVEKAQMHPNYLGAQQRQRSTQQRVRVEERASRRVARLNASAWQRDQAEITRQSRWRERQAAQSARAAAVAQRREQRDGETRSRSRRAFIGGALGAGAMAIGGGMAIAGATIGALGTLVDMASAAASLTAGIGGAVLEMIAFREAALTTLRVMARSENGTRLTGSAATLQAREQFNWAQQFARETPLEAQQVLDLQRQTSAAGFSGRQNRDVVSAAADVGAFNPADEGASGRFLLGLGQLRNASSVRLQDLRQTTQAAGLSEAETLRHIGRAAGVTQRQGETGAQFNSRLQQMQQRGRFTGEQGVQGVLAALRERNGGDLGSFARAQGDSLMGTLSNLRGAIFDFVTSIDDIESLGGIKTLKSTLNGIVRTFTGTGQTAMRMRATFAGLVNDVAQFFGALGGKSAFENGINDALDLFTEMRPVVTEVTRMFGLNFWAPVSQELQRVFGTFRGTDIREAAIAAGQLGRAMGNILAFGIDITAGMGGLAAVATRGLGAVVMMLERISDPEFPARLRAALDPLSRQNLLARIGIGRSGSAELFDEFLNIGREIPLGMSEGIDAESGGLIDQLHQLNADIAATTRDDLQIHSPSRLFADLGSQIPAGMAVGIDSGARDVERSLGAMVAPPSLPGFGGAGGGLAGLGGGITFGDIIVHAGGATNGEEIGAAVREAVRDEFERAAAMLGG